MDNKVFFQYPDLMRALNVHETVMQLMVNTLNKVQQESKQDGSSADMVVMCCRFLSYFRFSFWHVIHWGFVQPGIGRRLIDWCGNWMSVL